MMSKFFQLKLNPFSGSNKSAVKQKEAVCAPIPSHHNQLNKNCFDSNAFKPKHDSMDIQMMPESSAKVSDDLTKMNESNEYKNAIILRERLAHEMQKIESWRTSTQINLQQKDQMIANQEHLIIELKQKLQNNEIEFMKINKNLNHQQNANQEMDQNMENARKMLLVMKQNVDHVEDRFASLQQIKHTMDLVETKRIQQLNDMNEKMLHFQVIHNDVCNQQKLILAEKEHIIKSLAENIDKHSQQNKCLLSMIQHFEKQIQQNEQIINTQQRDFHQISIHLMDMKQEKDKIEEKLYNKQQECIQLNDCVTKTVSQLEETKLNMNETCHQMNITLMDNKHLQQTIDHLNTQLEANSNQEEQMIGKFNELEQHLEMLSMSIQNTKRSTQQQLYEYSEKEQMISSQMDALTIMCAKFEDEKIVLQKKVHQMQSHIIDIKQQSEVQKQHNLKNEEIIKEIKSNNDVIEAERDHFKESLLHEKNSLDKQIENMSAIIETCKSDFSTRVNDKQQTIDELKNQINSLLEEIQSLKTINETLQHEKAETSMRLQETMRSMTSSTSASTLHQISLSPLEIEKTRSPILIEPTPPKLQTFNPHPNSLKTRTKKSIRFEDVPQKMTQYDVEIPVPSKETGINKRGNHSNKQNRSHVKVNALKFETKESNIELSVNQLIGENKLAKVDSKMKTSCSTRSRSKPPAQMYINDISLDNNEDEYDINSINDEPMMKNLKLNLFGAKLSTYSRSSIY